MSYLSRQLGATLLGEGRCRFEVWAPRPGKVELHLVSPNDLVLPMELKDRGYWECVVEGVEPGARYFYRLDGEDRPDPASRFQPEGVHGPTEVIDTDYAWQDECWRGIPLQEYIIYEMHIGTFSDEGTFEGAIGLLPYLKDLGITALEIMPVAEFPGGRNWGYDGVLPFAAQSTYGGPQGLKKLVDACHQEGLAVVLDVVYNHMGPEGNYLAQYGNYFTSRYRTPWGDALNFDGHDSDEVRRYFIENALYWVTECHIDALRLDAVHAILDHSAHTFLQELAERVQQRAERLNRRIYLIAESALNDSRLITRPELGGYGMDAQWNDDFHHILRVLLTGERNGYYEDFGPFSQLVKAHREGFVIAGDYSAHRHRRYGNSSAANPAQQFVVFAQNHDHVGNRVFGERLGQLIPFEALKVAAGAVLLSPFVPLLFQGEEYHEQAPFLYFISHTDPELVEAVRQGRKQEFAAFVVDQEPPDPQSESTFAESKLRHDLRNGGQHRAMLEYYKELIRLRKEIPALAHLSKQDMDVTGFDHQQVLLVQRWFEESEVFYAFTTQNQAVSVSLPFGGAWRKRLDSAVDRWGGPGSSIPDEISGEGGANLKLSPYSLVLFERTPAH